EVAHRERLEAALRAALHERHTARAEAETERARLYELLSHAPIAVIVVRASDRVIDLANARCEQLLGRSSLVGQPIADAFPELATGDAARTLERVLATGRPAVFDELPIVSREGAARCLSASAVAMHDRNGLVDRVLAVAVDVTEQVGKRRVAAHKGAQA